MDTGITANQSAITWQIEIVSTYPSLWVTLGLGKLIAASYCHLLPHSARKGYNIMNEYKEQRQGNAKTVMKNESGLKIEKIEKCFGLSPDIIIPYYFSVVSSWCPSAPRCQRWARSGDACVQW